MCHPGRCELESEPWRPLFDVSVNAYYGGDREAGEVACEQLLALDSLPDHIRKLTRQNQTYYARQLIECAPSVRFQRIEVPVSPGWSLCNPSIAASPQGFRIIVRSANDRFGYGVAPEFGAIGDSVSYL